MLGDRLFLPHLGCAVTMVNPSCRFTESAKGICPGFQDSRHPDLHSGSDQAFCHSEVPEKRPGRVRSLPAHRTFSKGAGSGMHLALEACAGHLHTVSQPSPHTGHRTSSNTYVHARIPSPIRNAQARQTTRTMHTKSLWHMAKTWLRGPCPRAGQYILPIHPAPLLLL